MRRNTRLCDNRPHKPDSLGFGPIRAPLSEGIRAGVKAIPSQVSRLCIVVVLLFMANACSSKNQIVGRWKKPGNNSEVLVFYGDGRTTATSYGMRFSGSYVFLDDRTVLIDMPGLFCLSQSEVFDYSISGPKLTLTHGSLVEPYVRGHG